MAKKKIKIYIEKFFVCPNCKNPLCRADVLSIKGLRARYCNRCGFDYADVIKHTPAGRTKKK